MQTFDHRHLFSINETEGAPFSGPAYQEEECCEEEGRRTSVSDLTSEKPLHRDDEQGITFEADVVARLMKEKSTKSDNKNQFYKRRITDQLLNESIGIDV